MNMPFVPGNMHVGYQSFSHMESMEMNALSVSIGSACFINV